MGECEMAKMKFIAEANLLSRGELRRVLKKADFDYDLNMKLKEEKGWFHSTFFVTMEGPTEVLFQVKKWLKNLKDTE